MAVRIVETSDPVETESVGAELAAGLADGDVVLVSGELGSGKTTLVRGAATFERYRLTSDFTPYSSACRMSWRSLSIMR